MGVTDCTQQQCTIMIIEHARAGMGCKLCKSAEMQQLAPRMGQEHGIGG